MREGKLERVKGRGTDRERRRKEDGKERGWRKMGRGGEMG